MQYQLLLPWIQWNEYQQQNLSKQSETNILAHFAENKHKENGKRKVRIIQWDFKMGMKGVKTLTFKLFFVKYISVLRLKREELESTRT